MGREGGILLYVRRKGKEKHILAERKKAANASSRESFHHDGEED
jgi:hypothetical protein